MRIVGNVLDDDLSLMVYEKGSGTRSYLEDTIVTAIDRECRSDRSKPFDISESTRKL